MLVFPQNVNHASSKTNTSFYILHLSSTELAIQIFPLLHILSSYKALLMQDYYKTFVTFFYDTCVLCKNTANGYSLLNGQHF